MKNILVTGANGQLGNELQILSKSYSGHNFIFTSRDDLDITDSATLNNFFGLHELHFCINCAAYTAVDQAEKEVNKAFEVNADAVETIAKTCRKHNTTLIHISTDFVFDGTKNKPYHENDKPHAINCYGQTKLGGEEKAMEMNPRTVIFRTSWLYSTFGNNFLKSMVRLGQERDRLGVVFDQTGTPTYARDLAGAILQIIASVELEGKYGIYHYSNEGVATWYDFAWEIMHLAKIDCHVSPIETREYPTPAKRPPYSVLNKSKIKKQFGLEIPHWKESLYNCLKVMKQVK